MRFKPLWTLALLVALAFACASPAYAGGNVSTCDEPSLLTALTGGGTVTFTCSGTITVTATITISSDTTIDGTGQNVTISGGGAVQVISVPSGVTLNLNKLTIANGNSASGGGGVSNSGTLAVTNSAFSGNTATFEGGGVDNSGAVTVTNSAFSGNSVTTGRGGAINDSGTVTITSSTFSGNSASNGGAIDEFFGNLTVMKSTFSANSAGFEGGAINNDGNGAVTVTNCTFSGNSSFQHGGGINNDFGGTVTVTNSTFVGNSSSFAGAGGGIANGTAFGTTIVQNTIVANSPSGGNCAFTITDGGGNLSWPDTTCPGINQDPLLDPSGLKNNGGPTKTIALLAGSPAINAAVSANCPATDQRGVPRPAGQCDIGAYQLVPFLSSGSFVIGDLNAVPGNTVMFWGAQWAKDNSLSGGPAPRAFKGFADNAPQSCGGSWTSDPGNSSKPPDSVPSVMPLIVSSSVTKWGGAITGDVREIVIVQTNPGYGPNPGHAGTGTVVVVLCGP